MQRKSFKFLSSNRLGSLVPRVFRRISALGNGKQLDSSTSRHFSLSTSPRDAYENPSEVKPSEETQDVTSIDHLMTVVRELSHPVHRSIMPMRAPLLWSETISTKISSSSARDRRTHLESEEHLPTRRMQDSYSELILPFHSQPALLDQYTNAQGGLRTGKLLEHLDSLAGSIAYKHVLGPGVDMLGDVHERGFYIVTAAVDRLDMLRALTPQSVRDLRLCGHVIYTGRSSMEVAVKMELLTPSGGEETVMLGRFSMVCRDASTQKAKPIPPLTPSTAEEGAIFAMGEARKQRKKSRALRSLDRVPPSSEEAATLHDFFLQHRNGQAQSTDSVWMGDTALENCLLMFPQERNVHSKVFGGYLMRLAYELSFTTAALFSRRPLRFLSLDGLSFRHPVPIGSILRLRSRITCTETTEQYPALAHGTVQADVVDVESGMELTTNDFRFTWCEESGAPLTRSVFPKTYQDAMEWLEGKRALKMGDEIRNLRALKAWSAQ